MAYNTDLSALKNADPLFATLTIEIISINALNPFGTSARTHNDKQITKIAQSIEGFGFLTPILIDDQNRIICGDGRVEALKKLGRPTVPSIRIDHLSEDQKRAYVIADNRLAELAGWDNETLAIELQHLTSVDLDFEIGVIGFETAEIDLLIGDAAQEAEAEEENVLPDLVTETVSKSGDLWLLGNHRLLCGDALDPDCYMRVLGGEQADMVFTDPPYNVPVDGHVCGKGKIKHREFVMASGEMSDEEFEAFLLRIMQNLTRCAKDGAILDVCMDWRHLEPLLAAGRKVDLCLLNLCVWNKDNGGMGSLYRSKHELVCIFKKGSCKHKNNVELGRYGRYRTNVWDYAGVNSMRKGRLEELALHPTVKPVALVSDAILDVTDRGDIVLDPFSGSGTTMIAAEKTGRRACTIELDPAYVDVSIKRFETLYGIEAIHADTGKTFSEIEAARKAAVHELETDGATPQTRPRPPGASTLDAQDCASIE